MPNADASASAGDYIQAEGKDYLRKMLSLPQQRALRHRLLNVRLVSSICADSLHRATLILNTFGGALNLARFVESSGRTRALR